MRPQPNSRPCLQKLQTKLHEFSFSLSGLPHSPWRVALDGLSLFVSGSIAGAHQPRAERLVLSRSAGADALATHARPSTGRAGLFSVRPDGTVARGARGVVWRGATPWRSHGLEGGASTKRLPPSPARCFARTTACARSPRATVLVAPSRGRESKGVFKRRSFRVGILSAVVDPG